MDKNSIRCSTCNGTKKIETWGMLYKECSDCSGKGWVEKKIEEELPNPESKKRSKKMKSTNVE